MDSLALVLKTLHVLIAIWTIAGLIGRWVVLARAARADELRVVDALLDAAGVFESRMVIPGSGGAPPCWTADRLGARPTAPGVLQGASRNWLLVSLLLYVTLFPLVFWVFVPRGRRFGVALQAAHAQATVTPELRAAFHDRIVLAAHVYEVALFAVILVLMITKPF